ncbi:MAG: hypothetical protein H7Y22_12125 [Gemmatimonadaceae bacterium]|nr:hypothetical protein [Gloeobacterales cyanobacterium ES-bin-141]
MQAETSAPQKYSSLSGLVRNVGSTACPHCGASIAWHSDGLHWHGQCQPCTEALRGPLGYSTRIEAVYMLKDDCYLNARGV